MSEKTVFYSIRQIVDLTGLSEFTLRGWETRYKAFKPLRTPTGRRKYSHSALQKALLLRELTLRNYRIGQIANHPEGTLQTLLEKKSSDQRPLGRFQDKIEQILNNVSLQNWDRIQLEFRRVSRSARPNIVLADFISPLVTEFGRQVASGIMSISQEHIFSSIVKEALYSLRYEANVRRRSHRFVIAAPEGDFHELGILIAHAMVAHAGIKSIYLGANTPKKDLCEAALRFGATHVLVGSTVSQKEGAKEDVYSYFHFLDRHLKRDISIWLGGRNLIKPIVRSREVEYFSSLNDFARAIQP